MKYVIILCDGMGDYPIASLGEKTPMAAAEKPRMDGLARQGRVGLARTLYEGYPTGSDTANLSVLGCDPRKTYTGRSPIEALGLGIALAPEDTVFRLNLVTLSWGDEPYEEKVMLDHSAEKISCEEAFPLVEVLRREFGRPDRLFYDGFSFRHVMIWKGIDYQYTMMPPHDILEQKIGPYLPGGPYGKEVLGMMKDSYRLLMEHPVNQKRLAEGKRPANSLWLWGEGSRPELPCFQDRFGLSGAVVTAVPLIEGLANGMGMGKQSVPGATADYWTNYRGKGEAALELLEKNDFVFVHIEAPDECGHDGDPELKKKSIEKIDREIVGPVCDGLENRGEAYRMLILPDHFTPCARRTHTTEPVPFLLYDSRKREQGPECFSEESAAASGWTFQEGFRLLPYFLEKTY